MIDYDNEVIEEVEYFFDDLKRLASFYIDLFFSDKVGHNGSPISSRLLKSDKILSMVLNTDICDGIDIIYLMLESKYKDNRRGKTSGDIKYLLKLLNDCAHLGIPKCFASGIVILYLHLCEGCEIS